MQPKRENQPTFFDLAIQQRGSANLVLETIAREVDFSQAEERVAATYSEGRAPDADASYTRKYNESFYGYKAHISSDAEHQLIRAAVISTAKVQDAHVFERIAPTDTEKIYGDKAYDTKANQAWLQQRGIQSGIAKKGAHHIKLTEQDRQNNHRKRRIRAHIERIFAHLKKWRHYRRVRYLGLARNQLELALKAVAYNLKRLAGILKSRNA